jgi:hypothetical protein
MVLASTQTVTGAKTFGDALLIATTPKITTGIKDANDNLIVGFTATDSSVDYLAIVNSATAGHTVGLGVAGSDSAITLNLTGKGTGKANIDGNAATVTNGLYTDSTLGSWTSGAGTVGSGDTYLAALQKIDGNVAGKQATLVSGTSIKTIGGQSVLGSGNLTIGGVSGVDWAPITDFTAGTASTSVIPMTADHTADCPKGSMLQLMINSVLQYAGVANITSNDLTIFGVPLSTSYPITALKCAPGRMYHDNYLLGGNYEAASTNTAINDVNGGHMVWGESPAVLLGFSIYAVGADTGTAPSVNMMINGNPVFTSDLTVTAAGTLYSSVVTADATNCTITYGDTWEVKVTKNGNGDGTSLTVIPKWGKI